MKESGEITIAFDEQSLASLQDISDIQDISDSVTSLETHVMHWTPSCPSRQSERLKSTHPSYETGFMESQQPAYILAESLKMFHYLKNFSISWNRRQSSSVSKRVNLEQLDTVISIVLKAINTAGFNYSISRCTLELQKFPKSGGVKKFREFILAHEVPTAT